MRGRGRRAGLSVHPGPGPLGSVYPLPPSSHPSDPQAVRPPRPELSPHPELKVHPGPAPRRRGSCPSREPGGAHPIGRGGPARVLYRFSSLARPRDGGRLRAAAACEGDSARARSPRARSARGPGGRQPAGGAAGRSGWTPKAWVGFWSRCSSWFPGGQLGPWSSEGWCRTSRSTGTSGGLRTPRASRPTYVWCSWWPISYESSSGRLRAFLLWGAPREMAFSFSG